MGHWQVVPCFLEYCLWVMGSVIPLKSATLTLPPSHLRWRRSNNREIFYATINRGAPDLTTTFSHKLRRRKRSKGAIVTSYYFPVLDGDKAVHIMETRQDPASINLGSALTNTGLLQDRRRMPQKLQDAYGQALAGQTYSLLNTSYKHKGILCRSLAWWHWVLGLL